MTRQAFLEKFSKEVLQLSTIVKEDENLLELTEWDSLAQISTIAFFDKELGLTVSYAHISSVKSMAEILNEAGV